MSSFNVGDAVFQLFNLGLLALIMVLIVYFSVLQDRRNQLDRIEKKIDDISEQLKKGND